MDKREAALLGVGSLALIAGALYFKSRKSLPVFALPPNAGVPIAIKDAFTLASTSSQDGFNEVVHADKMKAWKALYQAALLPASASPPATTLGTAKNPITDLPLAIVSPAPGQSALKSAAYTLANKNMSLHGKHFILVRADAADVVFWPVSQSDAEENASLDGDWKLFLRPDEAWDLMLEAGPAYAMNVQIS